MAVPYAPNVINFFFWPYTGRLNPANKVLKAPAGPRSCQWLPNPYQMTTRILLINPLHLPAPACPKFLPLLIKKVAAKLHDVLHGTQGSLAELDESNQRFPFKLTEKSKTANPHPKHYKNPSMRRFFCE